MNRARSSESLSSNNSSSSTEFTSDDDDLSADDYVLNGNRKVSELQNNQKKISNITGNAANHHHLNSRLIQSPRLNVFQNTGNLPNIRPNEKMPAELAVLQSIVDDLINNMPTYSSNMSPSISTPSSSSHQSMLLNNRDNMALPVDNLMSGRHLMRQRAHTSAMINDDVDNIENVVGTNMRDHHNDSDRLDTQEIYGRMIEGPQLEPVGSRMFNSNRGVNPITVRMCSKLVECRNLIEAIEFVEQNRDTIEDLTRIVTRDAPTFRNYDMTNYDIDYTVKESFNGDFWLDREPVVTTADGNCQYHAVSISLTGSEMYTPEVRLATAVAVIDNRSWFDYVLKFIDRGTVLDLVHTIARTYSWGDETTLKAIAVAINKRIFLYTCNIGKKDYELVKSLNRDELLDAFREKKYRGGTGIHAYADPLRPVAANDYIMLFHKSEHFIAVLPTTEHPTMFEPYNPIVPEF